ncbi:MAG: YihY/virulence factor BrkB family protein [Actinomycetia bacterium]|nr:YihY/virulence factor BrkB family protein [Actinomycetes bacterium]
MGSNGLLGLRASVHLIRTLISSITIHHTMLAAAGVAFYCALAIVPAITGVVSGYGLLTEPEGVADQLSPLTEVLPPEAGELVVAQLESVTRVGATGNAVGLALGVFGLLWLISNAVNALVMSIRLAHERRSPHNWVQGRIFAIGLSAGAIVVVTVVIWLVIALPAVLQGSRFDSTLEWVLQVGRWPLVVLIGVLSQSLLYRLVLGPRGQSRIPITIGATLGTAVWLVGTVGMGLFMSSVERLESTFGSLGAVVVLLVWFYLSAVAVVIGAEVDAVLDRGIAAEPANPLVGLHID